jgi:hypothetical protein
MKIRPVRAEMFHADSRTDMTKLILAFRNFVKAPKNYKRFKSKQNNVEGRRMDKVICGIW